MKISKRDNKALQKRLISIYEDIICDAESQFHEAVNDEIQAYLEEEDDFMEIMETYSVDALKVVYQRLAKECVKWG